MGLIRTRPICSNEEERDGEVVSCMRYATIKVNGNAYCEMCAEDKHRLHRR